MSVREHGKRRPPDDGTGGEVYVIEHGTGAYWGKRKEWVAGDDPRQVARFRHRDEAVNTLAELSARDVDLRGRVRPVPVGERGEPRLGATGGNT